MGRDLRVVAYYEDTAENREKYWDMGGLIQFGDDRTARRLTGKKRVKAGTTYITLTSVDLKILSAIRFAFAHNVGVYVEGGKFWLLFQREENGQRAVAYGFKSLRKLEGSREYKNCPRRAEIKVGGNGAW